MNNGLTIVYLDSGDGRTFPGLLSGKSEASAVAAVLRRNLFAHMIGLSVALHAAAVVWLVRADFEAPVLIPPQEGRASIELRASLEVQTQPVAKPEQKPAVMTPPTPLPPPPLPQPEPPPPELLEAPAEDVPIVEPPPTPPPAPKPREQPPEKAPLPPPAPKPEPQIEITPKPPEPAKPVAEKAAKPSPASVAAEGIRVDELPRERVKNTVPYPPEALAAGLEGEVVLRLKISASGTVLAASILKSSGVPSLDEQALRSAPGFLFYPGRRHGVAVSCDVQQPVPFTIRRY